MKVIEKFFSRRLSQQFIIVGAFFFVIKIVLRNVAFGEVDASVLAPVSVLYGFFISYLVGNQRSRYNSLFESDRTESSIIYSIFLFSRSLKEKDRSEIRRLIDEYLISQLDYKLVDISMTDKSFSNLAKFCMDIDSSTDTQNSIKWRIVDLISDQQEQRYKMQSWIEERMSRSEWLTVTSLFVATVYSFLQIEKSSNILGFALGVLTCTAATMIMLVLYKLNTLKLRSNNKTYKPLERLFAEMDLLPYYSVQVLKRKEAVPAEGQKIRVARYPHEYPDLSDKSVEVEEYREKDYS